jgi:hypothetical protein
MAATHRAEFKRDAGRIAQTSSLTRRQAASDLGIGLWTLNTWVKLGPLRWADDARSMTLGRRTQTSCERMTAFGVRTAF